MRDSQVKLPSGRTLAYTDIGDPGWPCVVFFHGAPSSRLRLEYLEPAFLAEGVRAVSPDRPGYGGSSAQPGRSMDDWPHDVEALAGELQLGRFVVAGHSSGGPYAVATAALLPERIIAAITLGGVTDMAWPAAWEGYPQAEAELMRISDEEVAVAWCEERFGTDGSRFMAASALAMPEPDEHLYEDERIAALLTAARAEAWRQGVVGYASDIVVQGRPWLFDASSITAPLLVLHGELDTLLPLAHSRHTADLVPGAELRILPGHGHFTILGELPRTASSLMRPRN